jgi:phage anti-repressor protein
MILTFRERSREAKMENPHVKYGRWLTNAGVGIFTGGFIFSLSLNIPQIQFIFKLDTGIGWIITIFGITLTIIGIVYTSIGLSSVKNTWQEKKFYYLKGLDNQSKDPPFQALPKMTIWYRPSPILLTIENRDLNIMFDLLQFSMKNIEKKIEQYLSKDIFFAGMAHVPCLFFIGYSFRNAHSMVTLIDHDHQSDKWIKLEQIDEPDIDLIVEYHIENEAVKYNNIAITIEFTSEILKDELPSFLQDSFVRIKSKSKFTHNLIKSQTTLQRIIEEIINELIRLNKRCDRLHLFISAQSTVVFELGRRYQDGMIGDITIYNYNSIRKGYSWAISLINKEIKLERFE